jgi:hypothetical protein
MCDTKLGHSQERGWPSTEQVDEALATARELRRLWVPKTLSLYATWVYSRIRPLRAVPPQNTHTAHFFGWMETPSGRILLQ